MFDFLEKNFLEKKFVMEQIQKEMYLTQLIAFLKLTRQLNTSVHPRLGPSLR